MVQLETKFPLLVLESSATQVTPSAPYPGEWVDRLTRLGSLPVALSRNGDCRAATELCEGHIGYSEALRHFRYGRRPREVAERFTPEIVSMSDW